MTSPEKLATPDSVMVLALKYGNALLGCSASDTRELREALRAEVTRLDAQRQGEGETRDAALEQAANLVECEYAADATQGRRLAQIAQHIRDLKKRGV